VFVLALVCVSSARASDDAVVDEEPYVSPFDESAAPAGDDEAYRSPFDDPAPVVGDGASDAAPADAITLEGIVFENREYFREETIRTFVSHPLPGRLDVETLERDRMTVEGRYQDRGYLSAKVLLRIDAGSSPLMRKAAFVITAGKRATIRSVAVHGNRAVSDEKLLKGMFTQPRTFGGAFGEIVVAISRAGFYHKPFLDQDIQVLLKNYYAEGYLEARVDEIRTRASADHDGIEVDIDVTEGAFYELAALVIEGDLPPGMKAEEARGLFSVVDGRKADLVGVQADSEALLNGWRRAGHPFAKVDQAFDVVDAPSRSPEHKGVVLRLAIDKGKAARIRKIHIVGNEGLVYGTMDHVIRRDVAISEGALYNLDLIEKSKRQIQATGFFSLVETRTITLEPATDETDDTGRAQSEHDDDEAFVDLEVKVTEQPTWMLSLAPAFVASEGPLLIGIVGDRNVAGSGISSLLVGTLSFQRQTFDFSIVEPRLLDSRIMLSGELHRRQINYPDFMLSSEFGGGARVMFPTFFDVFLSAGLTVEWGGVRNYSDTKEYDFVQFAESELLPMRKLRNLIEIGGTIDKRDNVLQPRNGYFLSGTLSYGGPYTLSAVHAMRAEGNARFFYTPFLDVTFKSNTRAAGVANPHGGPVPVTDRIFLGGFGSVRGYFPRSITPSRDLPTNDGTLSSARIGGTTSFVQNLEIEAPIFAGTPFRGIAFVDAGNTWGETDPMFTLLGEGLNRGAVLPLGLFWSVGLGVLIQTPLVPFRLEWSFPLTRRDGVDTRPMDFFVGVGSSF
jgi:outer membrane protein insertion porin family